MITRSKLVEQLRDYQLRSQHKWAKLTFFSPKPQIITRGPLISGSTVQHTRWSFDLGILGKVSLHYPENAPSCLSGVAFQAEKISEEKGETVAVTIVHVKISQLARCITIRSRVAVTLGVLPEKM
ncbi:hypothetical protein C5167_038152, partial [Papaver somniferum]